MKYDVQYFHYMNAHTDCLIFIYTRRPGMIVQLEYQAHDFADGINFHIHLYSLREAISALTG